MVEALNYDGSMSLNDVRRESQKQIDVLQTQIDNLKTRLTDVGNLVDSQSTATNYAGVVNILDNSLPEWSKAAYDATGVLPDTAGDGNMEAKDWYRQLTSDTALSPGTATAMKTDKVVEPAFHSLWAANEGTNADIPRWSKTHARFELGGVTPHWDLYYPIPNDTIFPGQRYTLQLEAMIAETSTDPLPQGMQLYGGLYDSTPGQEKYIEGGSFKITDDQGRDPGIPFGTPGSTSVDYQVLARTDSGEEAISNILNFPNAPSTFDENNHPRVKFSGVAGFIEFEIYRKIGTEYVRQYTVKNTIDGTYFDIGNPPEAIVSSFPSITTTAPKAYAVTTGFLAGTLFGLAFVRNALTILVPTTYNRSLTASGQQYFRIGITLPTTTAGQLWIRKIALSLGDGNWARSANDTRTGAHSTPSGSAATGSPPSGGGGGGGGGGVDPPAPIGGGHCVVMDTPVRMANGEVKFRYLDNAKREGQRIDAGGPVYRPIHGIKIGHASYILHVESENGARVSCTPDEPFITGSNDPGGTPLATLKGRFDKGEIVMVLTKPEDEVMRSRIISITEEFGDFTVGDPTVEGGIFIAGGFLLHNKPINENVQY